MSRKRAVILFFDDIPGFDEKYGVSEDGVIYNWETQNFIFPCLNKGYYRVNLSLDGKGKVYFLHRLLAQTYIPNPDNLRIVDHIDRDSTNNSLLNLRWCTSQENNRNKRKYKNSSSIYKGVSWNKEKQRWRARVFINKEVHLGYFTDEIEAAKVYDRAAREHHGEYANPNFVEDEEDITFDSEEEE